MTEGQNKIKVLQYLKILAILLWRFFYLFRQYDTIRPI